MARIEEYLAKFGFVNIEPATNAMWEIFLMVFVKGIYQNDID